MGSSYNFDDEKSSEVLKDDSFDNCQDQNEYWKTIFKEEEDIYPGIIDPLSYETIETPHYYLTNTLPENQEEEDESSNDNSTGNRRGRKTNNFMIQHSLTKNDCLMAKIQTGYFTFLIAFINTIMKKCNIKYFFLKIQGKIKSNINQDFRKCLNKKTIKEILYNEPISKKYKKYDKFENKKIIDRLEKENQKIILDILDKNFLFFFQNLFYLNIKKFNLSTFGLEPLEIVLPPNVKMFNNLLEKSNCGDFNEYKYKMEKCAKKYFISSNSCNSIEENDI